VKLIETGQDLPFGVATGFSVGRAARRRPSSNCVTSIRKPSPMTSGSNMRAGNEVALARSRSVRWSIAATGIKVAKGRKNCEGWAPAVATSARSSPCARWTRPFVSRLLPF